MSYYSNEDKKEIYNRWLQQGRPWFDIDASKEPTYAEKQIILEMIKRENSKIKRELELEKRTKQFKVYEKKGLIRDTIFDALGDYQKEVLYKMDGISLVEYYCESCFDDEWKSNKK